MQYEGVQMVFRGAEDYRMVGRCSRKVSECSGNVGLSEEVEYGR